MDLATQDQNLLGTLKRAAAVLKSAEVPFALAGGFAAYARGGTTSDHDVDFLIREADVDRVLDALADNGFATVRPPEDWLVKAYDEDRLVDLIHRPVEQPVTDADLAAAELINVHAIAVPVVSATTLLVHKGLAFTEHHCDFATALPLARSLREQIDWPRAAAELAGSPYALALLNLLERLEIAPPASAAAPPDEAAVPAERTGVAS
jgi:hypothetical protein